MLSKIYKLPLKGLVKPLSDTPTPVIRHAVVEALSVPEKLLNKENLAKNVDNVVKSMEFHSVSSFTHFFKPYGISYLVVLEESHIAIHTWPEKGYIHLDVVTCTVEDMDVEKLIKVVSEIFDTKDVRLLRLDY